MSLKILLDNCIWGGVKSVLSEEGYDVLWIGDFYKDPGDDVIIKLAYAENRILITLDKDFGELAIFKNEPHAGIIRIVDQSATKQAETCLYILSKYEKELTEKSIITVDNTKIRIRTPQ